jgi:hypothetical protein
MVIIAAIAIATPLSNCFLIIFSCLPALYASIFIPIFDMQGPKKFNRPGEPVVLSEAVELWLSAALAPPNDLQSKI